MRSPVPWKAAQRFDVDSPIDFRDVVGFGEARGRPCRLLAAVGAYVACFDSNSIGFVQLSMFVTCWLEFQESYFANGGQ